MRCPHTTEYCSALKRKERLALATTRRNLEDVMVSEISQSQTYKYCLIPRGGKRRRQNVDWWLPGVGEEEVGVNCLMGPTVQCGKMIKF